jgi:truncated hemoglobin YjbI
MMVDPRDIPLFLNKPELKLLWQHIGSEARLDAILKDFYHRMAGDILIGFFFDGKDVDTIAAMQKKFLMRAMGASASYEGKPPAQAHDKLPPILRGHFDRRLQLLEQTLRDNGLSAEDIRTWITFENAFRDGIVRDEGAKS